MQRTTEKPSRPVPERPLPTETVQQIQEAVAEAQPVEQHIKQSEWLRYATNNHNEVIPEAIPYGKEYHKEVSHEADSKFLDNSVKTSAGGTQQTIHALSNDIPVIIGSGQVPQNHSLPTGRPSADDFQHLLPASNKNPVVANLTNPWFWIMLILIFAAFFTAALI
jgi:hypothetical protein